MSKYKLLFWFEVAKIIFSILNVAFLAKDYPELSMVLSIISIITSVAFAVAFAGADEEENQQDNSNKESERVLEIARELKSLGKELQEMK